MHVSSERLKERLDGRRLLVVHMKDVPVKGRDGTIMIAGKPIDITVHVDDDGAITVPTIALTREQALSLAMRLTEAVGAADFGEE